MESIDEFPPNLSLEHPKTTLLICIRLRACAHIKQGSHVTYKVHFLVISKSSSFVYFDESSLMQFISQCVVAFFDAFVRLCD